jgi:hypothetical protein
MTSDAASTQPRKRPWKRLIVALACVVAVTTIALLATPPKPEPVKVWFVRATNELGERKLVFQGTNGIRGGIIYTACIPTNSRLIPRVVFSGEVYHSYVTSRAEAGENFTFTLNAPPKGAVYNVMWWFDDIPFHKTRWGRLGGACYDFFRTHGMRDLAGRFVTTPELHYIPSTEIKE